MHQIQDGLSAFTGKINMAKSHFSHVEFDDSLYQIFKIYCMPLYGSQLWDYDNTNIDMFVLCYMAKGYSQVTQSANYNPL